jgi:hypothetical protein
MFSAAVVIVALVDIGYYLLFKYQGLDVVNFGDNIKGAEGEQVAWRLAGIKGFSP